MWSQRNEVTPVWSKLSRPLVRTNVSQMRTRSTRFRASAAFCLAKYLLSPATYHAASPPARVWHIGSPAAQGSLLPCHVLQTTRPTLSPLSPQLCPTHGGCFPRWSGVSFPTPGRHRPEGRAKVWWGAEPWGKGWGQLQPDLPPGQPSFSHPALHQHSKTCRAHRLLKKKEMNLDALFQQIQLTEKQAGEKRRLIQQGLRQCWPHLMASPFLGGTEMAPLRCREGSLVREISSGCFLPMACFCKNVTFTNRAHIFTGFCCVAVKADINRSYEKINQIKEELRIAKMKLETKVSRHVYSVFTNRWPILSGTDS